MLSSILANLWRWLPLLDIPLAACTSPHQSTCDDVLSFCLPGQPSLEPLEQEPRLPASPSVLRAQLRARPAEVLKHTGN